MPDLSSVVRDGFAVAISPQYINSVQHNTGYGSVQFGGATKNSDANYYNYLVVDRNEYPGNPKDINTDYHLPRLHKLITEIEPSVMTSAGTASRTYLNKNRFPSFARVGAGTQGIRNPENTTKQIAAPYRYLIGGTPLNITRDDLYGWADAKGSLFEDYYGPLANYAAAGDSGSPLWVFDKQENRWVYYAALRGGKNGIYGNVNSYIVTRKDWNNKTIQEDIAGTITNNTAIPLNWTIKDDVTSHISNGADINLELAINNPALQKVGKPPSDPAKNHGKTVYFNGQDGVLHLMQNLNQGAGALYFDTNFTVEGENDHIEWIGAGVSVAENKQVVWKIKNPANDRLSKIGKGTLLINGQGDNAGDISIGDGTVIFDQQGGKAFNKVGLVSGRPTLILNSSTQLDPNQLYFGFRGGRLDLNGNNLTFQRIQNVDEGARIVNNNATQTASITLTSTGNTGFNGYLGETDTSKHNGRLDVNYRPTDKNSLLLLSGGIALNGSLNVEAGQLMLSGRPTPHAYDHLNNKEVIIDDDWINRNFNATTISVTNDASLLVGRNVSQINANFTASQNAKLNLGFQQGVTPECIRSDYTGVVQCGTKTLSERAVASSPISAINGNVQLNGNSQLNLSRTTLTGAIQGTNTSNITLHSDGKWTLNDNSTIGNLTLSEGSKIKLNHQSAVANDTYHTLTINGNLSGNGYFHFLTNISRQLGDKIVVNGIASGTHKLFVENSGTEPKKLLTLFEVNNAQQDPSKLNISLANPNGVVDLGAFRYQLEKRNNQYVLALEHQTTKGNSVTLELPEAHFQNGKGVTVDPLPEVYFKSAEITVNPLPTADPDAVLANDNPIPVVRQNRIISRYSNGGLSEISAQVNALLQINANLHQVMSAKSQHALNVWATTEQQKTIHSSDNYRAYRQQINLTQVGVEKGLDNKFRLGAVLSNSHTSGNFDDQISQKGRFTQVAVYGKKTWNSGIFASLEASYGKARSSLNHQQKSEFSRHIVTTGLTLGTHWDLFDWDVSPTMAVHYHRLSEVNYNFDGANIKVNPLNLFAYQAGLSVGRDFKLGSFQLRPELSNQYIDASHNNTNVEVNGHKLHQQFGRYVRNQFGLSLKQSNWDLTLSAGLQQGNEVKKQRIAALKFTYYM